MNASPRRGADRDLRREPGRSDWMRSSIPCEASIVSGRRALHAVRLADRGPHALLQRGTLVGQQAARLHAVGRAEVVGELVEPVAAEDVGDDDELGEVALQARREERGDPADRVGLAVVAAPAFESLEVVERRVPLVEGVVDDDLPSSVRRTERVIGQVARVADVAEDHVDGALACRARSPGAG